MKVLKVNLGIDAAKDNCECNLSKLTDELTVKVIAAKVFLNTESGVKDLVKWMIKNCPAECTKVHAVIEASGVYHERFALGLQQAGYCVSVVLPNKAKKYMESLGLKSKNDSIDAKGLAQMGCEQNLEEWTPLSPFYHELRTYTRLHEDIQQKRTDTTNQLHALKHTAVQMKAAIKVLERLVKLFDKELDNTKKLIEDHVASNAEVKERMDKVCAIKGVAILSAATVVAEMNGFDLIENIPQLISLNGYDVVEDQSGKRVGRTKISKKGNAHVRRILHMPALNMNTHKVGTMPALFDRTFGRHGIKMKSYVALQRKLLVLIYTIYTKNEAFDKDYEKNKSARVKEAATSSRVRLEETGKAA
ncbi:MAG TPA: IS110 family transposase [Segetibacter sp.]|jgi:transposase